MPVFVVALAGFAALAAWLPWTVVASTVGAAVAALLAGSVLRLRRAVRRARYRAEVAEFRWRDDIAPLEFEDRCAEALRLAGWTAHTTKGSGDQGVDVLAERDGVRAALQCKRYGKTVGNKAVQEVLSGRAFYDAQHGIVVSNADFSPLARQLADKTGIMLMHFTELRTINKALGMPDGRPPACDARVNRLELRLETRRHWLALWILMAGSAVAISLDHDLRQSARPSAAAIPARRRRPTRARGRAPEAGPDDNVSKTAHDERFGRACEDSCSRLGARSCRRHVVGS